MTQPNVSDPIRAQKFRRAILLVAVLSALAMLGTFYAAAADLAQDPPPPPPATMIVQSGNELPIIPHRPPPPETTNNGLMLGMLGVTFFAIFASAMIGLVLLRADEEPKPNA